MAVVEVGLLSGYSASFENEFTQLIKRVEVKDDKLVLYFDQVSHSHLTRNDQVDFSFATTGHEIRFGCQFFHRDTHSVLILTTAYYF